MKRRETFETIDQLRLTDVELDALRNVSLPEGVKLALKKSPNDLYTTTTAYKKLAAMLNAQADADEAYIRAERVRAVRDGATEAQHELADLRRQRDEAIMAQRRADATVHSLQREKEALIAGEQGDIHAKASR